MHGIKELVQDLKIIQTQQCRTIESRMCIPVSKIHKAHCLNHQLVAGKTPKHKS